MSIDTSDRMCTLLGHGCHALVLLTPTLVLARALDTTTILFAVGVLATAYFESMSVVSSFDPHEARELDPFALRMAQVVGLTIIGMFWLSQIEHYVHPLQPGSNSQLITCVGLVTMVVGAGLRVVSIRTLKHRFLSDIRSHEERVSSGIYAWMRHPSELGTLWFTLGATLTLRAVWVTCLACVVLVPIYVWRVRREEIAWTRSA